MRIRKPEAQIEILFPDVFPERVPVRHLADALSAIHQLATPDVAEETGALSIRLVDVRRGSAVFRCIADESDQLIRGLRSARLALSNPEQYANLALVLPSLERLSKIAKALNSPVVVRNPHDRDDVIARFEQATYDAVARQLLVGGEHSLDANVQRVGGATGRRCLLRVPGRSRILYCDVDSDDIARRLGTLLYQDVRVSGEGKWVNSTWDIVSFLIQRVDEPKAGTLAEAFDAIREAGGCGWDSVHDPDAHLQELRGER
jgi:hypothetical protein